MKKKALLLMLVLVFISTNALAQNTIYGTVTGDIQEGVIVSLYRLTCGQYILEDTTTTDSAGYYAFSDLYHRLHRVIPESTDYSFAPESVDVQIPQTEAQSYDFTATEIPRFIDNGDGTVTDTSTSLVWLKNANCFGLVGRNNIEFDLAAPRLNNGECGLSDGSVEGDWRNPTIEEFIDIGGGDKDRLNDIKNCTDYGDDDCFFLLLNWTKPGPPFIEVQDSYVPIDDNGYYNNADEIGYHGYLFHMNIYAGLVEMHTWYPKGHIWPVRDAD